MYTPIKLDKMRNLRYGMKANKLIENHLNVKTFMNLDLENLSTDEIATLIWAGLYHEDNELTPDKIIDIIDEHSNLADVYPIVMKAYIEYITGGKQPKEENMGKQQKRKSSM